MSFADDHEAISRLAAEVKKMVPKDIDVILIVIDKNAKQPENLIGVAGTLPPPLMQGIFNALATNKPTQEVHYKAKKNDSH